MTISEIKDAAFAVGAGGVWVVVVLIIGTLIKTWPAIRQKLNEARQIELEGDQSLRADLLKRIGELEVALASERIKCEQALADIRRDMQSRYDGLLKQFLAAQVAWAQAIPPHQRSAQIDGMLEQLSKLDETKEDR